MTANPDLPILDELSTEFASLVAEELGESEGLGAPPPPPHERVRLPQPPRGRSRQARRVARRASIVLVLLCLVGGVALAARFGSGGDGEPAHTSPAVLGGAADGSWTLSAYRDHGRLCILLASAGELASKCGADPGPAALRPISLLAGGRRFVAGLADRRAGRVLVRAGPVAGAGRAADPTNPVSARAAGVPAGMRWFVVVLPRPSRAPARLFALDRRGRRLGPAELDCSLGATGQACLAQIRERAAGASR